MTESTHDTTQRPGSFSGSYERAVDGSGRFNLPFRFRSDEDGPDTWAVTLGVDGSLSVYPAETWDEVFRRAWEKARTAQLQAQLREVSANTYKITPDGQGRVMAPKELLEAYGIGKRVLVVGMGDHLELWHPETYTAHQEEKGRVDQEFLRKFFS